jgi:hypothetical protein
VYNRFGTFIADQNCKADVSLGSTQNGVRNERVGCSINQRILLKNTAIMLRLA